MALADCLRKFGKNISRADVDAINALIETGINEQDAVTQHLASIDSELSDIARRVEEAGGAVSKTEPAAVATPLFQSLPPGDAFTKWAGTEEPIIEPNEINDYDFSGKGPFILRAFHGTTHDFEEFDASIKGTKEGQFGAVNYFTSSEQDATDNYAGFGPDLTNRTQRLAEQIEQEIDDDGVDVVLEKYNAEKLFASRKQINAMDADVIAKVISESELGGGIDRTLELYLKTEKPFIVGDEQSPWFEFFNEEEIQSQAIARVADGEGVEISEIEENRDDYEDAIHEARYEIMDEEGNPLIEAVQTVADRHGVDAADILQELYDVTTEDEIQHSKLEEVLRGIEALGYAEDYDTGELIGYHMLGEIIQELGFDSIILKNAEQRFENMNIESGTAHVHIFDDNKTNIKSVENVGTFDPEDPRILYQPAYHGTPHRFDKFTLDNIGGGEGAQAYGYGLYFAERKDVAEFYRKQLSDPTVDIDNLKPAKINTKADGLMKAMLEYRYLDYNDIEKLNLDPDTFDLQPGDEINVDDLWVHDFDAFYLVDISDNIKLYAYQDGSGILDIDGEYKAVDTGGAGQVYKVELTPKDDEYLLWDKAFDEQSEKVKKALTPIRKQIAKSFPEYAKNKDITGEGLYRMYAEYAGSQKTASEALNSAGIKGIKYFDGTSRTNQEGTFNYVIFDEEAIQILETYYQGERGQITLFDNERVIKLAEASDLSTFLHESGHLFLEMEKHFAAQYGVTEDQQVLLDWMGVASFDDIQVEQHEQFARGFETYLREGVAPSLKLRDAFAAFRRWLTRIYQSIRQLDVTLPPEVTEVFDRLLASEVEIEEALANPAYDQFFRSKEQAGMTDAEWDAYQKRVQRAKDRAQMGLDEKLLDELRKRKTQEWAEEREPLIEEELDRISKLPVYSILSDTATYPMDYDMMKEILGFDKPPGKLIGRLKKGGVDPHEYAEIYGFNTVEAMVQAIQDAPKLKEAAKDAAEQRMIDKYGDILNDGSIEEEVREVIHNEEQTGLLLQELRALGKKTGKVQEINREYLKAEAKSVISTMKFKEIKPDKYYRAELRAAKKTITVKTDSEKYQAKLQQIANHYLYRESITVRNDMQKQRKYVRRVQTRDYNTSQVNPDYVQNMKTLANLYDLKSQPEKVQNIRNILEWYEAQKNDPNQYVDLSLLDPHLVLALEAKDRGELMMFQLPTFDDLTSSDLRGLYDMLRHLRYVGGQMSDMAKAEIQAKRNLLAESIIEHGGKSKKVVRGIPRKGEYIRRQIDHMVNKLPSLRNMMRKLDGFAKDDMGTAYDLIYRDIEDSNSKKIELQREMFDKFKTELNDIHSIGLNRKTTEHVLEDGTILPLATEHKFMMALNWGTETSREAIRDGFGVTDNDVVNILSTLDSEQLKVVNAVWKVNESMWPELSRASVELYGVAPPKLDPMPFTINGVTLTGGHMRLFYDSTELELKSEQETGKRLTSIMPTKAGSLHARVGSGGRPPALDIHNITRAINDNVHFIAFAESGKRLRALVNSKEVKGSIETKHGDGFYRAMIEAIDGITSNRTERESIPGLGSMFRLLRRAATFKHLAYSVRNSVQQFSAIPIATQEVGTAAWVSAFTRFVASTEIIDGTVHNDFVDFVTSRSKFMSDRASFVNREAAEYMRNLVVDGKVKHMWGQFERFGFAPQTFIDSLVAFPVWMAKYEQAMVEHGDDKKAVSQADTAVAESVGSGSDLHLGGAFMSNQSELVRTFTIFGTWFNAYYQRIYRATEGGTHYADMKVVNTVLTMPLIVGTLAAVLVMDGPDDDDDWWKRLGKNYIGFMGGTIPLLRDIVSSFSGFAPKTVFGGAAETPARVVAEIASYEKGKQSGLKYASDMTKLVTTVVPVPGIGNITRFMDYMDSYNRGKEGEWSTYQALVEGPDRNK